MTQANGLTNTATNGGLTNVEQRLQTIKQRIAKGRDEKARAEATLEQLESQRNDVLAELEELGVTEEQLPEEVARLETAIEEAMAEAEQLLAPTSEGVTAP